MWRSIGPKSCKALSAHLVVLFYLALCTQETLTAMYSDSGPMQRVTVTDAAANGGVCNDGSNPVYYIRRGDPNAWVVHVQGGGWCTTASSCAGLGTSWLPQELPHPDFEGVCCHHGGILSDESPNNEHMFTGWTRVFIINCDGSSFTSARDDTITVDGKVLHLRGRYILQAVVKDLLAQGLARASTMLFTGCSAGGLAALLNADYVRQLVPSSVDVKVMADGAWFIDYPHVMGHMYWGDIMTEAAELWNATSGSTNAKHKLSPEDAVWAARVAPTISTVPVFIVQALYDRWQMEHHVLNRALVGCLRNDPTGHTCGPTELGIFHNFGNTIRDQLMDWVQQSPATRGVFANACLHHCETIGYRPTFASKSTRSLNIGGVTAAEALSHFVTGDQGKGNGANGHVYIDECDWPCNESCLREW